MPRNPNKIKTSLFKAVQKQALLWSDGDLIIWGHQECTALHWLNPCHSAQSWKNWTFRLGKQGSAPQPHCLLCLLCQAGFFMRSLLLEEWAAVPVCVFRGSEPVCSTANSHSTLALLFLAPNTLTSCQYALIGFTHQSSKWIPLSATRRQGRGGQNFLSFWKWWSFSAV